jgi:hypothetical protein
VFIFIAFAAELGLRLETASRPARALHPPLASLDASSARVASTQHRFRSKHMKILAPRTHGIIDYLAVFGLALAPTLFGFGGIPATLCYALAVVHLLMSLLTAYPLGAAKIIPFPVHGGIEVVVSIFLVAAPWIFAFANVPAARNFFVASAAALLLVYLVTNYRAADAYRTNDNVRARHPA